MTARGWSPPGWRLLVCGESSVMRNSSEGKCFLEIIVCQLCVIEKVLLGLLSSKGTNDLWMGEQYVKKLYVKEINAMMVKWNVESWIRCWTSKQTPDGFVWGIWITAFHQCAGPLYYRVYEKKKKKNSVFAETPSKVVEVDDIASAVLFLTCRKT